MKKIALMILFVSVIIGWCFNKPNSSNSNQNTWNVQTSFSSISSINNEVFKTPNWKEYTIIQSSTWYYFENENWEKKYYKTIEEIKKILNDNNSLVTKIYSWYKENQEILLQISNDLFLKWKGSNKDLSKLSLRKIWVAWNIEVYDNPSDWCLYVYTDETHWIAVDYWSKELKINFYDNIDHGDFTFREAGQAKDIINNKNAVKCYYIVSDEDMIYDNKLRKKIDDRFKEIGNYVKYPIYGFKDKYDPYLIRRFREQYWLDKWSENVKKWQDNEWMYNWYINTTPVLYWKDPFNRWLRVVNMMYLQQAELMKPVIYLYPTQKMTINVKVAPNAWFKYTDPIYPSNWWTVVSDKHSNIEYKWKIYPYLFWEWNAIWYEMRNEWFVIINSKISIENFLNDKLSLLGLNQKEISDFKEYWVEKLMLVKENYIFITFASKEQQDFDAPLEIYPKPDNIIRVFMDYKWLEKYELVKPLEIKTPIRNWFSVVEWWGAKRW